MKKRKLIELIATICNSATCHTIGWEDDELDKEPDFVQLFQCTSYTVACLLAQNTTLGNNEGVESDVVLGALCLRPVKNFEFWTVVATNLVEFYNTNVDEDDDYFALLATVRAYQIIPKKKCIITDDIKVGVLKALFSHAVESTSNDNIYNDEDNESFSWDTAERAMNEIIKDIKGSNELQND
jgi:hypothetical protein